MTHRMGNLMTGAIALACLASLSTAVAEEDETPTPAVAATRVAPPPGPFGSVVKALDPVALARKRGGTDVFNDMKLKGVVSDNQAINLSTGSNWISDGAFSGATGLPMVIQNSGNNVLIQNATIVNVQVK